MQLHLRSLILRSGLGAMALALALAGGATAFAHGNQGNNEHTQVTNGHTQLRHMPDGSAKLTWNPTTKDLTIDLSVIGLAPNSAHPAQVDAGRCGNLGAKVYDLSDVSADGQGKGTSHTVVHNVTNGIPGHGWALVVQGTGGGANVACGNVNGPHRLKGHLKPHLATANTANVKLGPTKAANQHADGEAHLKLDGKTLTAKLNVEGLSQGTHAAQIRQGSCSAQGANVYDLTPLTAGEGGHAKSFTTIPNVSALPNTGWYVAVFATSSATGDMIACGNVHVGNHD